MSNHKSGLRLSQVRVRVLFTNRVALFKFRCLSEARKAAGFAKKTVQGKSQIRSQVSDLARRHTHTSAHMQTETHTHTHKHACAHTNTHIRTCTHVHTSTDTDRQTGRFTLFLSTSFTFLVCNHFSAIRMCFFLCGVQILELESC